MKSLLMRWNKLISHSTDLAHRHKHEERVVQARPQASPANSEKYHDSPGDMASEVEDHKNILPVPNIPLLLKLLRLRLCRDPTALLRHRIRLFRNQCPTGRFLGGQLWATFFHKNAHHRYPEQGTCSDAGHHERGLSESAISGTSRVHGPNYENGAQADDFVHVRHVLWDLCAVWFEANSWEANCGAQSYRQTYTQQVLHQKRGQLSERDVRTHFRHSDTLLCHDGDGFSSDVLFRGRSDGPCLGQNADGQVGAYEAVWCTWGGSSVCQGQVQAFHSVPRWHFEVRGLIERCFRSVLWNWRIFVQQQIFFSDRFISCIENTLNTTSFVNIIEWPYVTTIQLHFIIMVMWKMMVQFWYYWKFLLQSFRAKIYIMTGTFAFFVIASSLETFIICYIGENLTNSVIISRFQLRQARWWKNYFYSAATLGNNYTKPNGIFIPSSSAQTSI